MRSVLLLLAAAAIVAACGGGSNPTGPTSVSHRYSIDMTANVVAGNLCQWSETDHGSLVVTMSGGTGSVSNITNAPAFVSMTSCNSTCTEELVNQPRGPIDIQEVTGVAENPQTGEVVVAIQSKPESPQFKDTCAGQVTMVGGGTALVPSYISFIDDGASHDSQYTDGITGQSVSIVVTPLH
jgi:hypothetical protein